MKFLLVFALLLALSFGDHPPILPCDVSMDEIKVATESAYIARSQCESSNFVGPECDSYWLKAAYVLELETFFRQCRDQTVEDYFTFLIGTEWSNGEIAQEAQGTRDAIQYYAGKSEVQITNAIRKIRESIADESEKTRRKIVLEAKKTEEDIEERLDELKYDLADQIYAVNHSLFYLITKQGHAIEKQSQKTRKIVAREGEETRNKAEQEGEETRQVVEQEANETRHELSEGFHHTSATIRHEAEEIKEDIDDLAKSQNRFEYLMLKLLIESSFSDDKDASRIDLFQRPRSAGGYYETVKAIVQEVVAYNDAHYHVNKEAIDDAFARVNNYESQGNYRKAWERLRFAYRKAVDDY